MRRGSSPRPTRGGRECSRRSSSATRVTRPGATRSRSPRALAALLDGRLTVVFPYQPLFASVAARCRRGARARGGGGPDRRCRVACRADLPLDALVVADPRAARDGPITKSAGLIVFGSAREGRGRPPARQPDGADGAWRAVRGGGRSRRLCRAPPRMAARASAWASPTPRRASAAFTSRVELAARTGGSLDVIAGAGLDAGARELRATARPALPEVEREMFEETKATLERATAELGGEVPVSARDDRGRSRRGPDRALRRARHPDARLARLRADAPRPAGERLGAGDARGALPGAGRAARPRPRELGRRRQGPAVA